MINKAGSNFLRVVVLLLALSMVSCALKRSALVEADRYRSFAPDGVPFVVADSAWNVDMRGNHRAVVKVTGVGKCNAVEAVLPWRRPDMRPETKKIVVVDAQTGQEVQNVSVPSLTAEEGTVVFEPTSGAGIYHIYYLPYKYRRGSGDARYGDPWNDYLPAEYNADSWWATALRENLPEAEVLRFESRTKFDAFTPMGLIATAGETEKMLETCKERFMIFPEDRVFPISLAGNLPVRWVKSRPSKIFKGSALKNEYYVWQIGVWAAHDSLKDVRLGFSDLKNGESVIPKTEITCFNQEGINWDGQPVLFTVNVPKGKIQALWCGVQIPENAKEGTYKGTIAFTASGKELETIPVEISVGKEILPDKGDGDLWRMARLRWLNSTIGTDDEPVAPFRQLEVTGGNEIRATEKTFRISPNGLPSSIKVNGREILSRPFVFKVVTERGEILFDATDAVAEKKAGGLATWTSSCTKAGITFKCSARLEYDGYVHYSVELSSGQETVVEDIRLESSYTPYASSYFMGAGYDGGSCPDNYRWNWQGPWDSYWIGGVQAGLRVEYLGASYSGPLLNDYKPLPPAAWANGGRGTISLQHPAGGGAEVVAATGRSTISDVSTNFEFSLMVTPVKPLDTHKHFSERYYHANHEGFDKAAEEGANIINIHHSKPLNPVINYPFYVRDSLVNFVEHEHSLGRKVKLYYTIRELTNYAAEIHALRSLGHEIFVSGVGYGLPWHCEHLIDDYKPAWYVELPGGKADAALVLNGFSRWINYYLEGLRWMFENYKIDGIYMDDVSFDRPVMKRIRRIIEKYRPGALIDLHSNTSYSKGPANQYTGFFPYVDRLWFGEWFDYDKMSPDEWLVTFSGIPFGLMSDMLQGGGNRYLGMLFGSTTRHSYGPVSPVPVWSLWQSFGISEARMLGFWDEACPVTTSDPDVKATVYLKPGKALISIGNFSDRDKDIKLNFNWDSLLMDKRNVSLSAPAVENFQPAATFGLDDTIRVKGKEGWLLLLSEQD